MIVDVTAENTSDDTINFHPNQATITTNTGEQIQAEIFISDDVGGEFIGKVKKKAISSLLPNHCRKKSLASNTSSMDHRIQTSRT